MAREISRETLETFVAEALPQLAEIRTAIEVYRTTPDGSDQTLENAELLEARRLTHRIKGEASMIGLSEFSHIAFFQEELLEELTRDPEGRSDDPAFEVIEHTQQALDDLASVILREDQDILGAIVDAVKAYRRFRALPESQDERFIEEMFVNRPKPLMPEVPESVLAPTPTMINLNLISSAPDSTMELENETHASSTPINEDDISNGPDTVHMDAFRQEVSDHLQIVSDLLASDAGIEGDEFHQVRRAIHSVKGGAGAIGLDRVSGLAHSMEDLIEGLCRGEVDYSNYVRDLLINAVDTLDELVEVGKTKTNLAPLQRLLQEASEANTMAWSRPRDTRPFDELMRISELAEEEERERLAAIAANDSDDRTRAVPPVANEVADADATHQSATPQDDESDDAATQGQEPALVEPKAAAPNTGAQHGADNAEIANTEDTTTSSIATPGPDSAPEPSGDEEATSEEPQHLSTTIGTGTVSIDSNVDESDLLQGRPAARNAELDAANAEALAAVQADLDNVVPPELYSVFREEAEDHLKNIYSGLNALTTDSDDREELQSVRRSAHTLKGAAGAVGLRVVTKLSHRMEDLLDYLYENSRPLTRSVLTLLLNTTDRLHDLTFEELQDDDQKCELTNSIVQLYTEYGVLLQASPTATSIPNAALESVESAINITTQPIVEPKTANAGSKSADAAASRSSSDEKKSDKTSSGKKVATRATKQSGENSAEQLLRVPLGRIDDLVRTVSELIINRTTFEQRMADFVRCVDELQPILSRLRHVSTEMETKYSVDALRENRAISHHHSHVQIAKSQINESRLEEFDELEFDRYNEFHLLARTVSESTSDVNTITNELKTLIGDFDSLLLRQDRLSRDTQDRLMRVRMVPLATLATRLHRAVRVVASNQSKQVDLVVEGEDTELDKTVLEAIADSLLHLLRNAVDHGVEPADLRVIKGKPEKATIRIRAFYQGTQVVIRISDDGAGLDPKRIADAAVRKGYLSESDAESMTPQEIFPCIFVPGLTTASQLSEVSGRGVGMDIVRDSVQRLKGTITVDSEPDAGTTFTIRLPLTLAVTRALMVVAGNELFAIPMQSVVQIARVERDRVEQLGTDPVIRLNGTACPLIRLSDHLSLREPESDSATIPILIVRSGERQVAVRVERIVAGKDVVVKTLGSHMRRVPGLVGATLLGDGTVVPILDPNAMSQFDNPAVPLTGGQRVHSHDSTTTAMIVDDSVSVRRVMENLVKSQGWIPIVAKDGVDALEQLQSIEHTPDIFLLDIEMPRMDGYELLSTLRGMPRWQDTPIVMVTSRAGEKHRQKAFAQGASDYLVKPYQDETLIGLVKRLTATSTEPTLV